MMDDGKIFRGPIGDTTEVLSYVLAGDRSRFGEPEYDLLVRSYELAREAHEGQLRDSGEPYVTHCIETARILSEWRMDPATLCAALLHDTIEEAGDDASQQRIRKRLSESFPTPIPELVEGVTKISQLNLRAGEDANFESLRKLILAMSEDLRVTLIKLADRLHNMRTLWRLNIERQERIAQTTLDIYAPLAHRLGMMQVRSELEDLAFRYRWPVEFRRIEALVKQKREIRDRYVHLTLEYLRKRLKEEGIEAETEGRYKHYYSIYDKIQRQGLEFDDIYDLVAVRVICATVGDCYHILGLVHLWFTPIEGRIKDYIALPKENGYQSLHTTVIGIQKQVTEVQIRTQDMHRTAEYGVAAHWKYKQGMRTTATIDPQLLWLRRLTDWLKDVEDPKEFMTALRNDAFSETIQVLTPRGDVIELPIGSTPLDFAYAIHSDVGDHCDGAKVNHRAVPIRTPLENGDIVEIITRKNAAPSSHWLDIVKTHRARTKIRHYLRTVNWEQNVQHGREAMQHALRARGISAPWTEVSARIEENLRSLRAHTVDELLSEIGFGAIKAISVISRLYPAALKKKKEPPAAAGAAHLETAAAAGPAPRAKSSGGVFIEGMSGGVIYFPKCCSPLPGDSIVGFVTVGRGVSIHKSACKNLRKTIEANPDHQHRLLPASWDAEHPPVRAVEIRLICVNRRGLLGNIATLIASKDISIISSVGRATKDGHAALRLTIEIRDKNHLRDLLAVLSKQPDVLSLSPKA
ncbi:MAG: bifunctional (p)ppGpp synthetase/guanosine-3',5'-bis(diphosphate) 3'-pyrophosphohydrolase [Candidatus Sumerlaeota bacterium]|nr:bifunctional (p)ppGpp synthetase/guanosine-3',5'-bis(diphosphate) 3'-pyrophosphohydrolase [Candidatus Sumerlaeota bacterium]